MIEYLTDVAITYAKFIPFLIIVFVLLWLSKKVILHNITNELKKPEYNKNLVNTLKSMLEDHKWAFRILVAIPIFISFASPSNTPKNVTLDRKLEQDVIQTQNRIRYTDEDRLRIVDRSRERQEENRERYDRFRSLVDKDQNIR